MALSKHIPIRPAGEGPALQGNWRTWQVIVTAPPGAHLVGDRPARKPPDRGPDHRRWVDAWCHRHAWCSARSRSSAAAGPAPGPLSAQGPGIVPGSRYADRGRLQPPVENGPRDLQDAQDLSCLFSSLSTASEGGCLRSLCRPRRAPGTRRMAFGGPLGLPPVAQRLIPRSFPTPSNVFFGSDRCSATASALSSAQYTFMPRRDISSSGPSRSSVQSAHAQGGKAPSTGTECSGHSLPGHYCRRGHHRTADPAGPSDGPATAGRCALGAG